MSNLRQKFEKEFLGPPDSLDDALWGAFWMARTIIEKYDLGASAEINIRRLANELDGEA